MIERCLGSTNMWYENCLLDGAEVEHVHNSDGILLGERFDGLMCVVGWILTCGMRTAYLTEM